MLDATDWSDLASTHDIRINLKYTDGVPSGTVSVKPNPSKCLAAPVQAMKSPQSGAPPVVEMGPSVSDSVADATAAELLIGIGMDEKTARGLAMQFGYHRVELAVANSHTADNPSGYARRALQSEWKLKPPRLSGKRNGTHQR